MAEPPQPVPDTTLTDVLAPGSAPPPVANRLAPLRPVDVERYELRGEHGRGGLGVVMRALDRQLGREVAIKLLQNPSPAAGARFLREATITSRLQHPSIVTVLDVVAWVDGTPSYTMPLYPGRSLKAAIEAAPDFRARMALLPHVLAIADALAHAHGRHVIHRDIKPSNVLLGSQGETVVIDWGLAKSLDDAIEISGDTWTSDAPLDQTRVGEVMGTPAYMAPEQAQGQRVDQRADVYSLGALIYHVLSGRPPYHGADSGQILHKLLAGPPAELAMAVPAVPPELAAIVRKAMARDAAERYTDADALASDLRRFLTGNLVEAHAYTPSQLLWRWLGRHRKLVAVVMVALAIVISVVSVSFRRVQHERSFAQALAIREKSRADGMILIQAETALARDPTKAVAWLKTYPLDGADWRRVRAIGRNAVRLGVARHALHRAKSWSYRLVAWAGGRNLLLLDGRKTIYIWDVVSGERRATCLPDELRGVLRDESFGRELLTPLADGRILVWNHDLSAHEHVTTVSGALGGSLSSNGLWIAVWTEDGIPILIDRSSGSESRLAVGDLPVDDVRFVPGTERLLLATASGGAYLYDVGEQRVVYSAAPKVSYPEVSRFGPHVLLIRRSSVEWLDARTLESHALPIRVSLFNPVAFARDGQVAISERAKKPLLWEPRDGRVRELPMPPGAVGVASGGRHVGVMDVAAMWLMDLETNDVIELRGHTQDLGRAVEFVSDGLVASVVEDAEIRLWDVPRQASVTVPLGPSAFEPDFVLIEGGQALIMGAHDGRVLRRDLRSSDQRIVFETPGPVASLAATPDGATIVALSNKSLFRFERGDPAVQEAFRDVDSALDLKISPDGRFVVGMSFHERRALLWDLQRRTERRIDTLSGNCTHFEFSPNGRHVIVGCSIDQSFGFTWIDLEDGRIRMLPATSSTLWFLGFSPSGRYAFAGAPGGRIVRWNVETGAAVERSLGASETNFGRVFSDDLLLTLATDGLRLSWFSLGASYLLDALGNGRTLFASTDLRSAGATVTMPASILGWDLASGERWSAAQSDGKNLPVFAYDRSIVTSERNGTIRIWPAPGELSATPAETKAWLDAQTSVELGDELKPRFSCD